MSQTRLFPTNDTVQSEGYPLLPPPYELCISILACSYGRQKDFHYQGVYPTNVVPYTSGMTTNKLSQPSAWCSKTSLPIQEILDQAIRNYLFRACRQYHAFPTCFRACSRNTSTSRTPVAATLWTWGGGFCAKGIPSWLWDRLIRQTYSVGWISKYWYSRTSAHDTLLSISPLSTSVSIRFPVSWDIAGNQRTAGTMNLSEFQEMLQRVTPKEAYHSRALHQNVKKRMTTRAY